MNGIKNGKPYSAASAVGFRYYGQDTALFSDLSEMDQWIVRQWINSNDFKLRSKEIAYLVRQSTGVKITNNQVKDLMLQLGYKPVDEAQLNWELIAPVAEEHEVKTLLDGVEVPAEAEILAEAPAEAIAEAIAEANAEAPAEAEPKKKHRRKR